MRSTIDKKINITTQKVFPYSPELLLTYNRFDLSLKLLFLNLYPVLPKLAISIYWHDIRAQSLGRFIELDTPEKNSFDKYLGAFIKLERDISNQGFDSSKSVIPLATDGSIINGAHRSAIAIKHGLLVKVQKTLSAPIFPDYKYFLERLVPQKIVDMAALEYCKYSENSYLGFIWPTKDKCFDNIVSMFPGVVYQKEITLTGNGQLNLLYELYAHMDWIGTERDGFSGVKQKKAECFVHGDSVRVVLFDSDKFEDVIDLKKDIRAKIGRGFSSIHITDDKQQTIEAARLVLSDNTVTWLNAAQYKRYFRYRSHILKVIEGARDKDLDSVIVVGSGSLGAYGLRTPSDIDFLAVDEGAVPKEWLTSASSHQDYLCYFSREKNELIFDPDNYFWFCGLKFATLDIIGDFKAKRGEPKDAIDLDLIASVAFRPVGEKQALARYIPLVRYFLFVVKNICTNRVIQFLRVTRLYPAVRAIWRLVRK